MRDSALRDILRDKRLKVGIDVDGTLAMTDEAVIDVYNSRTNGNYSKEQFSSWSGWGMPMTFSEFIEIHDMLWTKNWGVIRPAVGQRPLAELADACNVEVLTHRPSRHKEHVEDWLSRHFPGIKLRVRCVDSAEQKLHMGHDVLFDDGNPVAEEFIRSGKGMSLYLIEQPWNISEHYAERSNKIIQVKSLEQGINRLLLGLRADSYEKTLNKVASSISKNKV